MFQNGLKNKDIDLLKVYKQKKEASPYVVTLKYLVFPISAAVILISWFGIVTYQNHALDSDIAAAKAELKQVQKQIAEDPNLEKYQSLQKAMNDVEKYKTLHKDIQSYPQLSQNTFDQILIASDVNTSIVSLSYQRETQVVTLQVESLTAEDTEQFVRRLKKSKKTSIYRIGVLSIIFINAIKMSFILYFISTHFSLSMIKGLARPSPV